MTKERLKKDFNVDADKVVFKSNGRFEYSKDANTVDEHYIIKQGDNYTVVCGKTNTVAQWRKDLKELEEVI